MVAKMAVPLFSQSVPQLIDFFPKRISSRWALVFGGGRRADTFDAAQKRPSLSLFCGALDKNPFRLLKTDRNEADAYTDIRRMDRGERETSEGLQKSDNGL